MKEKNVIILFGAGVYAKKYKSLLEYLYMDFDFFTDNDSTKWGTMLYGKPVISPDELTGFLTCKIIISSTHEVAIRKQLADMKLSDCILGMDDLYKMCEEKMEHTETARGSINEKETILVDMYEGIGWGGTELWAANLAYGLQKKRKKVILLGGVEQSPLEQQYENLTIRISEQDTIMHMVKIIERNLPCVVVNNFAGCVFMAAIIVKRKYPDLVKIISVIHNDNRNLFDAHMMLSEYIDKIFCVSNQICIHMQEIYGFDIKRYYFKEQPIKSVFNWEKNWNISHAIKIGYAARLVRQQKRADLIPDLIEKLEEDKIDYIFQIAGDGECFEKINKFVQENQIDNKVQLLGRLPKSEMDSFWKEQDIFVNVSEYEGTSLSMLEAMAFGCVPVVTDVSGAKEFIVDGKNGYICPVGAIDTIAEQIKVLAYDRRKLSAFGQRCSKIIAEKCNPEKYIEYWMNYII